MLLYVIDSPDPPFRDEPALTAAPGVEQSIPGASGTTLFVHTPNLATSLDELEGGFGKPHEQITLEYWFWRRH